MAKSPPRSSSDLNGCSCLLFLVVICFVVPSFTLPILGIIIVLASLAAIPWMFKIVFRITIWICELFLEIIGSMFKAHHLKKQSDVQKLNKQIWALKEEIKKLHIEAKQTCNYFETKDFQSFIKSSQFFIPKLTELQNKLDNHKENLSSDYYNQTKQKFLDYQTEINKKLYQIKQWNKDAHLQTLAPELWATYQQIKIDDATIREKIKSASNPAELTALHESNMKRFEGILASYLAIKESPKNYYNADQRLEQAQAAIEQFDRDLDETLRQLNEDAMHDFEVNLRLMKEGKDHVEN